MYENFDKPTLLKRREMCVNIVKILSEIDNLLNFKENPLNEINMKCEPFNSEYLQVNTITESEIIQLTSGKDLWQEKDTTLESLNNGLKNNFILLESLKLAKMYELNMSKEYKDKCTTCSGKVDYKFFFDKITNGLKKKLCKIVYVSNPNSQTKEIGYIKWIRDLNFFDYIDFPQKLRQDESFEKPIIYLRLSTKCINKDLKAKKYSRINAIQNMIGDDTMGKMRYNPSLRTFEDLDGTLNKITYTVPQQIREPSLMIYIQDEQSKPKNLSAISTCARSVTSLSELKITHDHYLPSLGDDEKICKVSNHDNIACFKEKSTKTDDLIKLEEGTKSSSISTSQSSVENKSFHLTLYPFVSSETVDLAFQEKEIIEFKWKLDYDWYFGTNGLKFGQFPASYTIKLNTSVGFTSEPHMYVIAISNSSDLEFEDESNLNNQNYLEYSTGDCFRIIYVDTSDIVYVKLDFSETEKCGWILRSDVMFPNKITYPPILNKNVKSICIAMYDFSPSHDDDLEFIVGSVIEIIEMVGSKQEWLRGYYNGKYGLVPINYVEILQSIFERLSTYRHSTNNLHVIKDMIDLSDEENETKKEKPNPEPNENLPIENVNKNETLSTETDVDLDELNGDIITADIYGDDSF
ncbi:hypothetical protein A3Q56_03555 [Intoshia linei]|uniref:SH3 domain-containing protein n=1 Tax=Intoshia linei TaxID=1819745 RepID=A0A177B4V3_9BILA|nr:hypothetical protein A3Q56_03555 [Intoshia linei]